MKRTSQGTFKQDRGTRLPIKVNVDWGVYRLKEAVFEKFERYNDSICGQNIVEYDLVYKNGQPIVNIPGTQDSFTIQKYKNDLGVGYQSINVYLLPHNDQNTSPLRGNCFSEER